MIPVEGIALLIGVDRFMSEARAVTNLIGNGVACVVVSKSEKSLTQLWKNVHFRKDHYIFLTKMVGMIAISVSLYSLSFE